MKIREFHDFMNFSWFCYKVSATVFTRCLPLCLPGVWPGVWPGVSPVFDPVLAQCLTRWCQWSDTVVYPVVSVVGHSSVPGSVPGGVPSVTQCNTRSSTTVHHNNHDVAPPPITRVLPPPLYPHLPPARHVRGRDQYPLSVHQAPFGTKDTSAKTFILYLRFLSKKHQNNGFLVLLTPLSDL